jgi:hypothetical protein
MASGRHSLDAALRRVDELERELAALRALIGADSTGPASNGPASTRPTSTDTADSDAAFIRTQLADDILRATRVRSWREPHPFGSSVAREGLAEAILPTEITIDADDVETLPRQVRLRLAKDGAELSVTARLRADDGDRVLYAVEEHE